MSLITKQPETKSDTDAKLLSPEGKLAPFNYDLEAMQAAVEGATVDVPKFDTDEEFFAWVDALTDADFTERS